jgi:cyanate permease
LLAENLYVSIGQVIAGATSVVLFGFVFDRTKSFAFDFVISGTCYLLCLVFGFAAINLGKKLTAGVVGVPTAEVNAKQASAV